MTAQIAVLDTLAQLGCDPSVKDSVMSTPMHVAAGEGHTEAIVKLVALVSSSMHCSSHQNQDHSRSHCGSHEPFGVPSVTP